VKNSPDSLFRHPEPARSAAKDLLMRCKWLVLRILRSFAVYAAQDDGTTCPAISSQALRMTELLRISA